MRSSDIPTRSAPHARAPQWPHSRTRSACRRACRLGSGVVRGEGAAARAATRRAREARQKPARAREARREGPGAPRRQRAHRLRLAPGRAPAHARRQAASGLSPCWPCSRMALQQHEPSRRSVPAPAAQTAKTGRIKQPTCGKERGSFQTDRPCDSVAPPCTQHSSARPSAGARPGTHDAPPGAPPPLAAWSIICCIACGARARGYGACSLYPWVCTLSLSLGPRQVDWQTHQAQPPDGHAWNFI